jgi:CheY-like chemotaxis protein
MSLTSGSSGCRESGVNLSRVLLADDSAGARTYFRTILSAMALCVEEAADGAQAFSLLLGQQFDLLITDLNMAPITGAQLVMAVQLLPAERRPKIIVCSADAGSSVPAIRQAVSRADRFLTKPVAAGDLVAAVTALVPGALRSRS